MGQHFQGCRLPLQPRLSPHLKTQSQTHLEEGRNSRVTRASFQSQTAAQGISPRAGNLIAVKGGWLLPPALAVLPHRDCLYLCSCRAFRDL